MKDNQMISVKELGIESNKFEPKISVILPVYNVEDYLEEALNSLCNQTYSNFEAICINDGSTDKSLDILNKYAQKDQRFIVISQENQGQGVARNKAIDLSSGDYILFLDPDDMIEKDALGILVEKANINKDVDIIQFDHKTLCEDSSKNRVTSFKKIAQKFMGINIENGSKYCWKDYKKLDFANMSLVIWNRFYSAGFIKSNNIGFATCKQGEDDIFSLMCIFLAKKILYIDNVLYNYRIRNGSLTNKATNDNFCVFENIKNLKEFFVKQNLFERYEKNINRYIIDVLNLRYAGIPEESKELFLSQAAQILTPNDYKLFLKTNDGKFSFWENIFSIKNSRRNGQKIKIIRFLGVTFKISGRH